MTARLVDKAAYECLHELKHDILDYLYVEERSKTPISQLINSQPQIRPNMRPRLLAFLSEAQCTLGLLPDTFTLAVSVMDRYMSSRVVFSRHYQLLGCVCLWLAAKIFDSKSRLPTTAALSYLCANTYSESMIREMELHVLITLDWNVLAPLPNDFMEKYIDEVAQKLGSQFRTEDRQRLVRMTEFVCDCALFDRRFIGVKRSKLVASSVTLAMMVLNGEEFRDWPHVRTQDCEENCFQALVTLMANPPEQCCARHSSSHNKEAVLYFSEFYARLATSSSKSPAQLFSNGINSPRISSVKRYSDAPAPIIVGARELYSDLPISPPDDELESPSSATDSPNTYFVPLTPEKRRRISVISDHKTVRQLSDDLL